MSNFKVTAIRVVGEVDTREEARELAQATIDREPDIGELTIREATGASADEKMCYTAPAESAVEGEPAAEGEPVEKPSKRRR